MVRAAEANGIEGVVFRKLDAPAVDGPDASVACRLKFRKRAEVIVLGAVNGKKSVHIGLYRGDHLVAVGCCTMPGRTALPETGAVIEIEYLYATANSRLCQPVFIRHRADKPARTCTMDQLQYATMDVLKVA